LTISLISVYLVHLFRKYLLLEQKTRNSAWLWAVTADEYHTFGYVECYAINNVISEGGWIAIKFNGLHSIFILCCTIFLFSFSPRTSFPKHELRICQYIALLNMITLIQIIIWFPILILLIYSLVSTHVVTFNNTKDKN
jgi:hypothetical protein